MIVGVNNRELRFVHQSGFGHKPGFWTEIFKQHCIELSLNDSDALCQHHLNPPSF